MPNIDEIDKTIYSEATLVKLAQSGLEIEDVHVLGQMKSSFNRRISSLLFDEEKPTWDLVTSVQGDEVKWIRAETANFYWIGREKQKFWHQFLGNNLELWKALKLVFQRAVYSSSEHEVVRDLNIFRSVFTRSPELFIRLSQLSEYPFKNTEYISALERVEASDVLESALRFILDSYEKSDQINKGDARKRNPETFVVNSLFGCLKGLEKIDSKDFDEMLELKKYIDNKTSCDENNVWKYPRQAEIMLLHELKNYHCMERAKMDEIYESLQTLTDYEVMVIPCFTVLIKGNPHQLGQYIRFVKTIMVRDYRTSENLQLILNYGFQNNVSAELMLEHLKNPKIIDSISYIIRRVAPKEGADRFLRFLLANSENSDLMYFFEGFLATDCVLITKDINRFFQIVEFWERNKTKNNFISINWSYVSKLQHLYTDNLLVLDKVIEPFITDKESERLDFLLRDVKFTRTVISEVGRIQELIDMMREIPSDFVQETSRLAIEVCGGDFDKFKWVIAVLVKVFGKDLASFDDAEGKDIGGKVAKLAHPSEVVKIARKVAGREFRKLNTEAHATEEIVLTEENWLSLVMAFVRTTFDDHELPNITEKATKKVVSLFQRDDVKTFCLNHLKQLWLNYLQDGRTDAFPFRLMMLTSFVDDCEGAGPLMQFEALSTFINKARLALSASTTTSRTAEETLGGMKAMEERFTRERWSNEDQADFYNVSRDILNAAPSLYANFLETFKLLSPAELKRFVAEVYPLFRAQLAVMPRTGKKGEPEAVHNPRDLVEVRQHLRQFALTVKGDVGAFDHLKKALVADITENFKSRFGIIKIPEQFTEEHVRSLTNVTLYLANLHDRTELKEKLLGLYLALLINGQWDHFRRGGVVNPKEYLTEKDAAIVGEALERRTTLSPLSSTNLGIAEADLPEFQALLQGESANLAVGDVETIDVKLGNVIFNLHGLRDPDLYPDPMDKKRLLLLSDFGNKPVGATAAKFYLQLNRPDRAPNFSAVEEQIRDRMTAALEQNGIAVTAENVKLHFQEGIKALAVINNVLQSIEELGAEDVINHLRGLLHPSDEVIAVFTRLGEEFKPTSGAMALTQDLDYLDNLIVKRQDELKPEERELLVGYVGSIRAEVVKLQGIYDQVKTKFANVRGANVAKGNALLQAKLVEVERIINNQAVQQSVTSTMTNNLNSIIENIRECLSCTRQGCNNDTDLTFGDSNKFFVYSNSESQRKGSVADQIVFLEPVTYADGSQEMAFVFDRVYGSCTPFILTNHIAAAFKKYSSIKKRFPNCKLSLVVTDAAISTGGLSKEQLSARLLDKLGGNVSAEAAQVEVDVAKSPTGDHYVEFGGGCRETGKRSVSGLVLKFAA